MPLPLTKLGRDVFAPVDASGAPRSPDNGDAVVLTTEYEALLKALIAGSGGITLLPDIINAVNSGAGTADAIKATASGEMATSAYSQLITVNFTAANTGPMTISINDETPRPLVTNTGQPIPAGYVSAGMSAMVQIDGTGNYRLFSYGDAGAIQAIVEALLVSATAEAERAETAAGGVASAPQWAFASKAALALFSPAVAPSFLEIAGARYELAASEPSHPGKAQDGAGNWYEFAAERVSFADLGALPSLGNVDVASADAIAVAAALSKPLYIPAGRYMLTSEVNLSELLDGAALVTVGGLVEFNFEGATDPAKFPNGAFVFIGAGPLVQLPYLNGNVAMGDSTLTFLSDPGLVAGDRVVIFNPTDYSLSGWKAVYKEGENVKISDGSGGSTVKLYGATKSAYTGVQVDLYKHPNKKICVEGGTITIKESRAGGLWELAGFKAEHVVASNLDAFRPTQAVYAGMYLKQCVDLYGDDYVVRMQRLLGTENAYGLILGNTQGCRMHGYFDGGRHGLMGGGDADVGCIPTRDNHISGYVANAHDALPSLGAVNFHGNCLDNSFTGTVIGGANMGGNGNEVRGEIYARRNQNGLVFYFAEMLGTSFKVSGRVHAPTGDVDTPVVSIGDLGSSPLEDKVEYGGVLDFSGVEWDCPEARKLIVVQTHGANPPEPIILDVRGGKWLESIAATHSIVVSKQAGAPREVDLLLMDGFVNGPDAPYSVGAGTKVRGWRQSGRTTLAPSTSASVVTGSTAINAPKTPVVVPGKGAAMIGGKRVSAFVDDMNTNALAVTVGVDTNDGEVFSSTAGGVVHWVASLDE